MKNSHLRAGAAAALLLILCVLFSGCELLGLTTTYTVTFDTTGGGPTPAPITVKEGGRILLPNVMSYDRSLTLIGWMPLDGRTMLPLAPGYPYTVTRNVRFTAVWSDGGYYPYY